MVLVIAAVAFGPGLLPVDWTHAVHARGSNSAGPAPRPADRYRPPTSAPVIDPFRPPPEPWLPGNRGIEYGTTLGSPITAIGPGMVAFAGSVAGRLVVSIDHSDGLRSSYVGLAGIAVSDGDHLVGGQIVGLSGESFHLGVRRGSTYLDPASLWGTTVGAGRVRLVPVDDADPPHQRSGEAARQRVLGSVLTRHLSGSPWG